MEFLKVNAVVLNEQDIKNKLNSKENICRLCLCTSPELCIFSDLSILSKIQSCCTLELFANDGLPDQICTNCNTILDLSFNFKNKCLENDKILRRELTFVEVEVNVKNIKSEYKDEYLSDRDVSESFTEDFLTDDKTNVSFIKADKQYNKTNNEHYIRSTEKHKSLDDLSDLSDDEPLKRKITVSNVKKKSETSKCGLCPCCGKVFLKRESLIKHLKIHNRTVDHICNICSKTLSTAYNLSKHMRVHSDVRDYSCDICGKQFKSSACLKDHTRIVHKRVNAVNCHLCNKELSSRKSLKLHIQRHTGEIQFLSGGKSNAMSSGKSGLEAGIDNQQAICEDCGKQFKNSFGLQVHKKQVHKKLNVVQCHICSKKLSCKPSLKMHLLSHSGEKDFECNICNSKFASKAYLVIHLRVHSGEKPYSCKFCEKKFAIGSTLRAHERLHTGEKPFSCPFCPKKFSQRSPRRGHIIKHHKGEKK